MKILKVFFIVLFLLTIRNVAFSQQFQVNHGNNLRLCSTLAEALKHENKLIRIVGVYNYFDAGKCWAARLMLKDNKSIIIRYQPTSKEVEEFNQKAVIIVAKVNWSSPPESGNRQVLLSPHIFEIQSMEVYTSSLNE